MEKMGIQENNKIINQKSIGLSGDVHEDMKLFCKRKGVKISWLVEQLYVKFKKDGGNTDTLSLKEDDTTISRRK